MCTTALSQASSTKSLSSARDALFSASWMSLGLKDGRVISIESIAFML